MHINGTNPLFDAHNLSHHNLASNWCTGEYVTTMYAHRNKYPPYIDRRMHVAQAGPISLPLQLKPH